MTTEPVDQLASALSSAERLVAAVGEEQWTQPTPCTGWTVRDLVNHIVAGNKVFTAILHGEASLSREDLARRGSTDQLGVDPLSAYRNTAAGLIAAFGQPGVLQQSFTIPIGTVPGIAALQLRIVETLVHGWDLARATGQEASFPADLVETALAFTESRLSDLPPAPEGRGPFGPAQTVPDDAPPIDRLAALLGRAVPA